MKKLIVFSYILTSVTIFVGLFSDHNFGPYFEQNDKLFHLIGFFVLSFPVFLIWQHYRTLYYLSIFIIFAIVTENIQEEFVPNRQGDLGDLLMSFSGIGLAGIIGLAYVYFIRKYKDL